MLYRRDYFVLTDDEKKEWDKAEKAFAEAKGQHKNLIPVDAWLQYFKNIPKAALHYQQLFPNNYLHLNELLNTDSRMPEAEAFKKLVEGSCSERDILDFIREKEAYFIISAILRGHHYGFGHHSIFVFKEFPLPPNFAVDFLLVGQNSHGYHFVFVEMESPGGAVTTKHGQFGNVIRKGINQVNEWDAWIDRNYHVLKLVFDKYIGDKSSLPREFFELDKTRVHYAVVAGRRSHYNDNTYRLRRKLSQECRIQLLHYDNLFDFTRELLHANNH